MDLIDGDISNEPKTKRGEPLPAVGMSYCCPRMADSSAAAGAYGMSVQKSKDARDGIPVDERPKTDSLYFGKV